MKKINVMMGISLLVITGAVLQNCNSEKKGNGENGGAYGQAPAADTTAACVAPTSWFPHSQTPPPQEGAGSSFANPQTTSNCDFHLWSWQKFLYLTQTDKNGKARFENLVQINNKIDTLGSVLNLIDSTQAGTHTILADKKNRAIYYSIYMDTSMYHFSLKYVDLFKKNCDSLGFLSTTQLKAFGYDTLTYPVGAFEIKAAWILVSSLDAGEAGQFYTTSAIINKQPVQVALVGMHIVGRVINHPELIWATYQHLDAAPVAKWPSNAINDTVIPDQSQILSPNNKLFYNAGLALDCCYISINKKPNVKTPFKSIYHLFDHGTQVPYPGILPNLLNNDTVNLKNITTINASVLQKLATESGPWKFYEYYGSIWIDPTTATLQPNDGNIGLLTRANLQGVSCT